MFLGLRPYVAEHAKAAVDENRDLILGTTDRRALTPLVYSQVNPYGTFKLDVITARIVSAGANSRKDITETALQAPGVSAR